MAHKHNRRRVRPRVRQNRQSYHINNMSYDTLSLQPQFTSSPSCYDHSSGMGPNNSIRGHICGITNQYPLPRVSSPGNIVPSPKTAIKVQSERIKMFGGEPGDSEMDHIGLCFKMAEVFEGMDWINV